MNFPGTIFRAGAAGARLFLRADGNARVDKARHHHFARYWNLQSAPRLCQVFNPSLIFPRLQSCRPVSEERHLQ